VQAPREVVAARCRRLVRWSRLGAGASRGGRGYLQGRVERQGDAIHVLALGLERLSMPRGEELPTRSRDFH
jgi:hypothetical protein